MIINEGFKPQALFVTKEDNDFDTTHSVSVAKAVHETFSKSVAHLVVREKSIEHFCLRIGGLCRHISHVPMHGSLFCTHFLH